MYDVRGNSKYHYYGIRIKPSSPLNALTDDTQVALRQSPSTQKRYLLCTKNLVVILVLWQLYYWLVDWLINWFVNYLFVIVSIQFVFYLLFLPINSCPVFSTHRIKPASRADGTEGDNYSLTGGAIDQSQPSHHQHQEYLGDITQGLPDFEDLDTKGAALPGSLMVLTFCCCCDNLW